MTDRQGIIDRNNQQIQILKNQLNSDMDYQKGLEGLTKIKRKYSLIQKKIEENNARYELEKENKNIITYSNQIQLLTETIMEKEQKIRFIQLMLETLGKKENLNPIQMFIQFYQQNQKIAWEELNENVSLGRQFTQFTYLFYTILKEQRQQPKIDINLQARLSTLLANYHTIQDALLLEKNNKEEILQQDRHFQMSYPQMQRKLESNKKTAYTLLQQLTQYIEKKNAERACMQDEIMRLEQENSNYQKEIEDLRQIFMSTNESLKNECVIQTVKQYTIGN